MMVYAVPSARITHRIEINVRPLIAGAHAEVDAAPVHGPFVGDPPGLVAIRQRNTGASDCRSGRDDRPGSKFANLVHWYFPQLEPGSEQDSSAHHDHVDAFGGQLARSGTRGCTPAVRGVAGDVRIEVPVAEVAIRRGCRAGLHDAQAPDLDLSARYACQRR